MERLIMLLAFTAICLIVTIGPCAYYEKRDADEEV
jgi:hypothetical protein